ncbi:MAG: type II toxin-antitoxin system YafQ family toxin [Gemmatimonadaceae bacterium]|nr:type II toxin-antitoxin system YafQ family toxin [Gemmatimonadaceae bacterium]
MRRFRLSGSFKRDRKRAERRGKDLTAMETVMRRLALGERLEAPFRDHKLKGEWRDSRECHIEDDWVLIYRIVGDEIHFLHTGTHSDLFE